MKNRLPKLVIIEDEPILLQSLTLQLADSFQVFSAQDGEAGLELIYKQKPAIILLDFVLPRMSGFEILARIKKDLHLKKITVIALSNRDQKQEQDKAFKLGVDEYFIKSNTDLNELVQKLKQRFQEE